jgi:Domain of Unknown Function with PDB structure (DUF3857)/Transglutaminase-like superfamily
MRSNTLLALVCIAPVVISPKFSLAQFQPPSKEELQMTEDPKARGSDAIYLYREEVTDDALHFQSYYVRIKVLTEKGKELATVHVPYEHGVDSVTDIQGRTIHSDGTVVPLTAKPADLMDYKAKDRQVNTVVFTLPNVEVGSILEYRLKVRLPDNWVSEPTWNIQQPYFVRQAHYSFHPHVEPGHFISDGNGNSLNRLLYAMRIGSDAKLNYEEHKDTYSIDLADIPAIPKEDWMPPLNTFKWRIEFYYTNATSGPNFWEDAGKQWFKRTQAFANPNNGIKSIVAGIVAPADTDEQKARKIYAAVQKLDNTAFSREKSSAELKKEKLKPVRNAEDVWKQQSGTDDDIALLFVALARAAGLKAYPAQVVNRNRAIFDDNYLSVRQLDDYLAIVALDGKELFLDPGQKMCPFGLVHWKHTLASGLRASESGPAPVLSPALTYKSAIASRNANLDISPDGSVTGSIRYVVSGTEALHWRQLALENDQDEVKKRFIEAVQKELPDGVHADFDHFLALDDYNTNLMAVVKITGNIGAATGKRFFLPGLFFQARAEHPFVAQDKRTTPVDVQYPKSQEDEVTYHLPAGFSIESGPQQANAAWPNHAILKINSTTTPDSAKVVRLLVYNFALLGASDYPSLHDFYQKVATADQQQLVLTRAVVAKGN